MSWSPNVFPPTYPRAFPGFVAVTPAGLEPVEVRVDPAIDFLPAEPGWPAAEAGRPFTFRLVPGQVAHLLPTLPPPCTSSSEDGLPDPSFEFHFYCPHRDHDPTGTAIEADGPLAVYGGHVAAKVPVNYDSSHPLFEQLPPVESWGRRYQVVPMGPYTRRTPESVGVIRILGTDRPTRVTFSPITNGLSHLDLPANGFVDVVLSRRVVVEGDHPILVALFSVGAELLLERRGLLQGFPSMLLVPPVEQYRDDVLFTLPDLRFEATRPIDGRYLLFIRATDSELRLDGSVVEAGWRYAGPGYEWAAMQVEAGVHRATSDERFALFVYATGQGLQYSFSAGTDLRDLEILR